MECTADYQVQSYNMLRGTAVTGIEGVYSTNINGVGVKVTSNAGLIFASPPTTWLWNRPWVLGGPFRIRLYKTGSISGGALSTGRLFSWTTPKTSGGILEVAVGEITGGSVTSVACSISTPNISVPLGDVEGKLLTGVGTTVADKQFNIGLNCDSDARVNVTLQGTQNPDTSNTSVLALTNAGNAGTANGVGVQLLYNGAPLTLNNRIILKTSSGGQESLPFVARYFQTKNPVSPGQANATATLNLTYQ